MALEGTLLGYYRLLHQIGSGGMGTIYLAQDTHLPRQVALKVVRTDAELYQSAEMAEKVARLFQREVQMIAQLDHPHILPVIDTGQATINTASYIYLVMPYCPEGSLADWLRKRQQSQLLTIQDISTLLSQAAEALHYAHEHLIIHQDVKPSNFMLRTRIIAGQADPVPDVLLADFGLAQILSTASSANTQGIRGTPFYMPPEQWDGEPVPASDQYALAVMAFQLLTGQFPFQGRPGQIMRQHYTAQPAAPGSLNPQLTPALDAVILRALAKQATERFPSVKAFAQAFRQALSTSHGPLSLPLAQVEETTGSDSALHLLAKDPAAEETALLADELSPVAEHVASTPTLHTVAEQTLLLTPSHVKYRGDEAECRRDEAEYRGDEAECQRDEAEASSGSTFRGSGRQAPIVSRLSASECSTPPPQLVAIHAKDKPAFVVKSAARKKHPRLARVLVTGIIALVVLVASSTFFYQNTIDAPSSNLLSAFINPFAPTQASGSTATAGGTVIASGHGASTTNGSGSSAPASPSATTATTPSPVVTIGATPIGSPVVTPQPTRTPLPPGPGPRPNLLTNPSFESYQGWCAKDNRAGTSACGVAFDTSSLESGDSHSGTWHLLHGSDAADVTTYQTVSAPYTGTYSAFIWVKTSCGTKTTLVLQDTTSNSTSSVVTVGTCIQGWTQVQFGALNAKQGDTIVFKIRSINTSGQWARFDDANLGLQLFVMP